MKVITDGGEIVLGTVEATPTISLVDYSRRETDEFGVTTVVKRGFARRMSVRLAVPFTDVDRVYREAAALRATATVMGEVAPDAPLSHMVNVTNQGRSRWAASRVAAGCARSRWRGGALRRGCLQVCRWQASA